MRGKMCCGLIICLAVWVHIAQAEEIVTYRGASDASAAVAVAADMFIVADDENNVLRIYGTNEAGSEAPFRAAPPSFSFDMTESLSIDPEHPEADIEGATMIGGRIYWITSHGRNKDGKMRPNRYRFFATAVEIKDGSIIVRPEGTPRSDLVQRLVVTWAMRDLGLDRATRFGANLSEAEREKLAPKKEGLNIEALCASADGKKIYIGFRNPRPVDKSGRPAALVVPLHNPSRVIEGGEAPIFGEPMLWDLAGLGLRSMEHSDFHKAYFIIAGASDETPKFALYRWSGQKDDPPVLVRELNQGNFSPEALVPFKDSNRMLVLSDDGSLPIEVSGSHECAEGEYRSDGTCLNKHLLDPDRKTFRAMWLAP